MKPERWHEIERVIDAVLDEPPARWSALLDELCGNDAALRSEVERLLAQHHRDHALLDSGAGEFAAQVVHEQENDSLADPLIGTELGRWTVQHQIGRGGMSRVYLGARSDGTFEQRVAIKVLRAGLDTSADIERFRFERQVLARLEHPFIARLLDGGVTPDGRPYLVLEYVEGEPLTGYCSTRALDIPARLRLFLSVAEALQSAHRQLVVHRDLKPSNIMVGGDGRPRLLDFGIAALLDPESQSSQPATVTRRRWLTPDYAAPEQFTGAAITTATDVYQLGAVLYELLSGQRIFRRASPNIPLEQRILNEDAAAPSTHAPAISADLDAIILKALRKEPDARYASVTALSADIQRALDGAPVKAREGDRVYRWQRTLRRRALPISLAAAAMIVAVVYAGTLTVQNRRISLALTEANTQREKAEQVTEFLLGLFQVNDPTVARGDTISARALLARGVERAGTFGKQPEVQAELFDVIGRVHSDLGAFDEARPNLERALIIRRELFGDSSPDVAETMTRLAQVHDHQGRYADAVSGYRGALARQQATLGDTSSSALRTLFLLAAALHASSELSAADTLFRMWDSLAAGRPLQRDLLFASQLAGMGQYLTIASRKDTSGLRRAARYLRDARSIRAELLGTTDPAVSGTSGLLAGVLWNLGDRDEADALFKEALSNLRIAHPNGHPRTIEVLLSYAADLVADERYAEALPLQLEAYNMATLQHGPEHPTTVASRSLYGNVLRLFGDFEQAVPVLQEASERLQHLVGEKHLLTLRTRVMLGDALRGLGRLSEAQSTLLSAYSTLAELRGVNDAQTQFSLRFLVRAYEQGKRSREAAPYRALLASDSLP